MLKFVFEEGQSFNSAGRLLHKLAVLNINVRCPYDCFNLGNFNSFTVSCFLPGMDCAESLKLLSNVTEQQII